jgi:hypothetical protein
VQQLLRDCLRQQEQLRLCHWLWDSVSLLLCLCQQQWERLQLWQLQQLWQPQQLRDSVSLLLLLWLQHSVQDCQQLWLQEL